MNFVKGLGYILSIAIVLVGAQSFVTNDSNPSNTDKTLSAEAISWHGISDLDELKSTKPIIVDIYTEWCGWCKKMDQNTFGDAAMIKYLNENFTMVKLDAEHKESISFNGETYEYRKAAKRGVNELAVKLLNGKLSYPSLVVLDTDLQTVKVMKGFKDAMSLKSELEGLNL